MTFGVGTLMVEKSVTLVIFVRLSSLSSYPFSSWLLETSHPSFLTIRLVRILLLSLPTF